MHTKECNQIHRGSISADSLPDIGKTAIDELAHEPRRDNASVSLESLKRLDLAGAELQRVRNEAILGRVLHRRILFFGWWTLS